MTNREAIPKIRKRRQFSYICEDEQHMKTFARLIALILACVTCLLVVVACDTTGDDPSSTYDPTKDENGRLKDDLPDDLNYMGEKITTLYWEDVEKQEYEQDTITGENVADAIYERNQQIQDRLNVELAWAKTPGNVNKRAAFVRRVQSVYDAHTQDYDLISSYSRTEGMLAIQGYLVDLMDIENSYINLEQPWWPKQLVDTVRIGDSVYFISGDCSTNVLHLMYTMFFNKDLLNRTYNSMAQSTIKADGTPCVDATDYLYNLVYEGKWTIDELINLTSGVYNDRDGNNEKSEGDYYGFCTVSYHVDAFYTGSNMRYVDQDNTNLLVISPDYGSRKTVQLVNKLGNWLTTNDCWAMNSDSSGTYTAPFRNGNALFCQNRAYFAENALLKVNFSYGLVPTPKYDGSQLNYYSVVGNPFSLYGIFSDCDTRGDKQETWSMLSAVIECWCSEGYRLTTPEIFEVNMQLKYSETQDETNMFEEVRAAITFDLGRIFTNDLSFMSELPSKAAIYGASWSTSYAAYKRVLNRQIATIVEQLRNQGTV